MRLARGRADYCSAHRAAVPIAAHAAKEHVYRGPVRIARGFGRVSEATGAIDAQVSLRRGEQHRSPGRRLALSRDPHRQRRVSAQPTGHSLGELLIDVLHDDHGCGEALGQAREQNREPAEVVEEALGRYLANQRLKETFAFGEADARKHGIKPEDVDAIVREERDRSKIGR